MRDVVLGLIEKLGGLDEPVNYHELLEIINSHSVIGTADPLYKNFFEQLNELKKAVEEHVQLTAELSDLNSRKKQFDDIKLQKKQHYQIVENIEKQINLQTSLLRLQFKELEQPLNQHILKHNPLAMTHSSAEDLDRLHCAVSEFHSSVKTESENIKMLGAQAELLRLKNEIEKTESDLSMLGFDGQERKSPEEYGQSYSSVRENIATFESLQSKTRELYTQFAQHITRGQLQNRLDEMVLEQQNLIEFQKEIEDEFRNSKLAQADKESLTDEFLHSDAIEDLIKSYEDKVNAQASYFSVSAWREWAKDAHYNDRALKISRSTEFLKLLKAKDEAQRSCDRLSTQIEALQLDLKNPCTEPHVQSDSEALIDEAVAFFSELPKFNLEAKYSNHSSIDDFYLILITSIPIINTRLDQYKAIAEKLDHLAFLNTQLERLRTDFKLLANADDILPGREELEQRKAAILQPDLVLLTLDQYEKSCDEFLKQMQPLEILNQKLKAALDKHKVVSAQLDAAQSQKPLDTNINLTSDRLRTLETRISQAIHTLSNLSLADAEASDSPEELEILKSFVVSPDTENPSLQVTDLNKYHDQNMQFLAKMPPIVSKWYLELAKTLENADSEDIHRITHLIRDILFEFKKENDLNVIYAYMRICPNPAAGVSSLLDFKPGVIIVNEPYRSDELKNCPTELIPHYKHYEKLKKDYPVEAELFLQALRSVHFVKKFSQQEEHTNRIVIPALSQDPRYAPLKEHRGFLRIWQLLEELFHKIIRKINGEAEPQFGTSDCFFKTKSIQLLEEADRMTAYPLPG